MGLFPEAAFIVLFGVLSKPGHQYITRSFLVSFSEYNDDFFHWHHEFVFMVSCHELKAKY